MLEKKEDRLFCHLFDKVFSGGERRERKKYTPESLEWLNVFFSGLGVKRKKSVRPIKSYNGWLHMSELVQGGFIESVTDCSPLGWKGQAFVRPNTERGSTSSADIAHNYGQQQRVGRLHSHLHNLFVSV